MRVRDIFGQYEIVIENPPMIDDDVDLQSENDNRFGQLGLNGYGKLIELKNQLKLVEYTLLVNSVNSVEFCQFW